MSCSATVQYRAEAMSPFSGPNIVKKSTNMDPKSSPIREAWVPGVTWELPGETLGPTRRPGQQKT